MKFSISYSGYRYAPESFVFYVNNEVFAPRYSPLAHDLAMIYITKGHKECMDQLKREYRKQLRTRRRCLIGFYIEGTKQFVYTQQLTAYNDDLMDKLRVYKEFKRFIEANNGIVSSYEVDAGTVTPGSIEKPKTVVIEQKADLKRPVKIYLKEAA